MDIQPWVMVAVNAFNAFVGWKTYRLKEKEAGATDNHKRDWWFLLWLACLAVIWVPYLYLSRPTIINISVARPPIQQYGILGTRKQLYAVIDTSSFLPLKENDEIMMIARPGDHFIDAFKDAGIARSAKFAITGETVSIQFPISSEFIDRAEKFGGAVEFYLIVIPKKVTPESISNLSDVTLSGGTIAGSNQAHVN
jgi:hypothetical protein